MKRLCLVLFSLVLSLSFLTNIASAANVNSDEYNTNNRFISNNNMNSDRYNPSNMTNNRYNPSNMSNRYNPTPVTNTTNTDDVNNNNWGWLGLLGLVGLLGFRKKAHEKRI
ncbi:WGxxGxxG family protein [Gottfriedia acidiceleris]|uniref:WGxxGxxG family protein n=1 Tax=Gottfriedia acidiceleris TaxID=371036 RepID=UPI00101CFB2C|nr:WGxxGxxG family protein [Gottfriedia acidiceleris]